MNIEKLIVFVIVLIAILFAALLSYASLKEEGFVPLIHGSLAIVSMLGALVVLKVYEVWRK